MYCSHCGTGLDRRAHFCHRCGTRVAETAPQTTAVAVAGPREVSVRLPEFALDHATIARPGRWRGISGSGGIVMLVAFFLPWVSVSCDPRSVGIGAQSMQILRFSGLDVAAGPRIDTPFGSQQAPGSPLLWLVPLAALAIIACAVLVKAYRSAALATIAGALVSLVPMLAAWQSFDAQRTPFIRVSVEFGLWLSLLGVILGAVGGFVGLSSVAANEPAADKRGELRESGEVPFRT